MSQSAGKITPAKTGSLEFSKCTFRLKRRRSGWVSSRRWCRYSPDIAGGTRDNTGNSHEVFFTIDDTGLTGEFKSPSG